VTAGVLPRSQDRAARAGVAPEPLRRGAAQVQNSSMVSGTSIASSRRSPGGYPRASHTAIGGKEDQKQRLQELLRETRELKAQEAHTKFSMRRDEEKLRKAEKKEDEKEIMAWRQEVKAGLVEHEAQIKKEQRTVDVAESKQFQEYKKEAKATKKEAELQLIRQDYAETKENSEWATEVKKLDLAEWPKPAIEENLEKYRLIAEYNMEEQTREDAEKREARAAKEQAEVELALMKARQDRELAAQALEYTRAQQEAVVPTGRHLAARPK